MMTRPHILVAALLPLCVAAPAGGQRIAAASSGGERSVLEHPAQLDIQQASLTAALLELARSSRVPIAFSPSVVSQEPRIVSCACRANTVAAALDHLLDGTRFRYAAVNGQVMIYGAAGALEPRLEPQSTPWAVRVAGLERTPPVESVLLRLQETFVAGRVVEVGSMRPVVGAQILVVGTERGTLTDGRGRFRVEGLTGREVRLRVVRIGYRTLDPIVATGTTELTLELTESAVALDEIVVTGQVGSVQRRAIGHSVAKLDAAEIVAVAPVRSMGDLLQGSAPGVVVSPASGMTGTGQRISIRGRTSLSLSSDPLLYIDGVRVDNAPVTGSIIAGTSRLNDIDPDNVESIEIIKGPAAATLYGTEASNGVIQIITKKGRPASRPTVNVTLRQGAQWFADPAGRIAPNWGIDPATGTPMSMDLVRREADAGNPIWTTGHLQGYGADVNGGSDVLRYYLGLNYDRDRGIEPTNQLSRFSTRGNLSVSPAPSVDVSASFGLVRSRTELAHEVGDSKMFSTLAGLPIFLNTPRRGFFTAPPEVIDQVYDDLVQTVDRTTASLQLNHRPTSWLTHRLTTGVDFTTQLDQEIIDRQPDEFAVFFGGQAIKGSKYMNLRKVAYTTLDYSATASFDVGTSLGSATSGGVQYYRNLLETQGVTGTEFPAPELRTTSAAAINTGTDDYVENATVGVFLQQQLSWRNRAFLTAAIRADDNSAFGENFDLVFYPKVSATWIVHEEPFWGLDLVDALKLRAAYGQSGQQPQAFAAVRTYQPITGPANSAAVSPRFVGNPDLAPERGEEFELGFEVGMLDDRVGIDFTYYHKTTRDVILLRDIPPSLGFPGQQFVNAGSIGNRGIELLLTTLPLDTRTVDLELSLNLATNDNEILDLGSDLTFIPNAFGRHQVGYPIASFFRRRVVSAGVENGRAVDVMCDDGAGSSVACSQAPDVFLGSPLPKWEGSIISGLTLFGRLRLHGKLDFKRDFVKMDGNNWVRCSIFRACEINFFPDRFDPVSVAEAQLAGDSRTLSGVIRDASYTKLRELSATYSLPADWAGRIGASRVTITVAGRNLHTWTKWPGLDPESLGLTAIDLPNFHLYFEQFQTPQTRQFVWTLNFTF